MYWQKIARYWWAKALWLLMRMLLLNVLYLLAFALLALGYYALDEAARQAWTLPIGLYIIAVLLCNLVYAVGNSLEALQAYLWQRSNNIYISEKRYFAAALLVNGMVNSMAALVYMVHWQL